MSEEYFALKYFLMERALLSVKWVHLVDWSITLLLLIAGLGLLKPILINFLMQLYQHFIQRSAGPLS